MPRRIQPGEASQGMPVQPRAGHLPPRRPVRDTAADHPTEIIHLDEEPELARSAADEKFDDQFDDEYDDEYDDFYEEEDGELDALVGDEYDDYDDEGADPEYVDDEEAPRGRRKGGNRKKKRAIGWVAALAVIVLLGGGAWYGVKAIFGYADFDGPGSGDVIVEVADGDSTSAIGATLTTDGVVASAKAFVKAAADNSAISKVQHGYYVLQKNMSGAAAVTKMVDPASHVGQLEVRAYTQFDDSTQPGGKVTPGIFSLISKASCAPMNGTNACISVDDLRKTVENTDLATLGVPQWALDGARKAPQKDRGLEGLIAPGVYDVKPGWTPVQVLSYLVKNSVQAVESAGLNAQSTVNGQNPYQVLVIASIIEREAVKQDFGKISRVIYNRLAKGTKLQMDSTVNYLLDKPVVLTKPEDRAKAGPYNTYLDVGLPPTPISAPSPDAIQAAMQPTPGDWIFFVKCETNGLSCFAVTDAQHEQNKRDAQARGVY
ncbi:MAG: hypothetical protein JWQ81_901 [Amycolatopsis sp.]|nr:hypothetical protein [Amycolatopsis sp.]